MDPLRIRLPATESEEAGMEAVYECLVHGARQVEKDFTEQDDDWMAIWLVLTPEGTATFLVTDMEDDGDKSLTAHVVGQYAQEHGAHVVGFISSTWTIQSDQIPESERDRVMAMHEAGVPVSQLPYRREQVMVALYTASQVRIHEAEISRSTDAPPTLGPFRRMDMGDEIGGRMVDPVQAGLRRMG